MDHPHVISETNIRDSNKSFSGSKPKKPATLPTSEPTYHDSSLSPASSYKNTPKLTPSSGHTTISSTSGDISIQLDPALRPKTC